MSVTDSLRRITVFEFFVFKTFYAYHFCYKLYFCVLAVVFFFVAVVILVAAVVAAAALIVELASVAIIVPARNKEQGYLKFIVT